MNAPRSVAITSAANLIPPLAGLAVAPILAQELGATGRGEVAAATAPLLLVIGVFTLGLPEALTYFYARHSTLKTSSVAPAFVLTASAGVIAALAISFTSTWLSAGDEDLSALISLLGWLTPIALLTGLMRGKAMGLGQWHRVFMERLFSSLMRLGVIVALVVTDSLTILSASLALAVTSIIGGVAYIVPSRRRDNSPAIVPFRAMTSYGARVWGGSVGGILLSRLDQVILLPLAGAYELGLYAVAVSLVDVVLVFNAAVSNVVFAMESQRADDERLAAAARVSTLGTLALAAGAAVGAVWLIPWAFGEEFGPAVPVFALLALGVVLGNPGSVAGAGLNSRGRPGLRSASLIIATVVNLMAVCLLAPTFGAMGAAAATLVGNVVAGGTNLFWLNRMRVARFRDFLVFRPSDLRAVSAAVRQLLPRNGAQPSG